MRVRSLIHKWVSEIPSVLDPGMLYVSLENSVAIHSCCCGCGVEVVTPLHPTDWKLVFNGETISLRPSIGNWNLECRSHYFITNGSIEWAAAWSKKEIENEMKRDNEAKKEFFEHSRIDDFGREQRLQLELSLLEKIRRWWHR